MIRVIQNSLLSIISPIEDSIKNQRDIFSPENGFIDFVIYQGSLELEIPTLPFSESAKQRILEAPILATLGYELYTQQETDNENINLWVWGFNRLAQRAPFQLDRQTFIFRPIELLGVCLGAVYCQGHCTEQIKWLREVLTLAETKLKGTDIQASVLSAFAAYIQGVEWGIIQVPGNEHLSLEDKVLLLWLSENHPDFASKALSTLSLKVIEESIYDEALNNPISMQDSKGLVLLYSCLMKIKNKLTASDLISFQKDDPIALLEHLFRRFHHFAKRMGTYYRKEKGIEREPFTVRDEYDLQHLMHALLLLHFYDVRDEEWTPSYAGGASRVDFLLKNERIFIEAKITSKKLKQNDIANQLIVDKERYRKTHPDCKALICFVYDPEEHCSNAEALEAELSESSALVPVRVIVSPKRG